MQSESYCYNCKNKFDSSFRCPKQLSCSHVICAQCVNQLGQQGSTIQCFYCYQQTRVSSLKISNTTHKIETCFLHNQQPLHLYCFNCSQQICMICASYSDLHKNHYIKDIPSTVNEIKKNELSKYEDYFIQLQLALNDEQTKTQNELIWLSSEIQNYNIQLENTYQNIIKKAENIKNQRIQQINLLQEQIQNRLNERMNKIQDQQSSLSQIKLFNQDDIENLNNYMTSLKLQSQQYSKFQQEQNQQSQYLVKIEYNVNIEPILNQLNDWFEFKVNYAARKQIPNIPLQVTDYSQPRQTQKSQKQTQHVYQQQIYSSQIQAQEENKEVQLPSQDQEIELTDELIKQHNLKQQEVAEVKQICKLKISNDIQSIIILVKKYGMNLAIDYLLAS